MILNGGEQTDFKDALQDYELWGAGLLNKKLLPKRTGQQFLTLWFLNRLYNGMKQVFTEEGSPSGSLLDFSGVLFYSVVLFWKYSTIHLVSYSMCPDVLVYLNFGFSSKVLILQVLILTPQTKNNLTNQLFELKRRIASFFSIRSLLDIFLREQASRLFLHENIVFAQ